MDRKTFALAPEIMADYARRAQVYEDALGDWVRRGAASGHALSVDEAQACFEEAVALAPENWSIRRQALWFESPEAPGGPKFWSAVDALGARPYYRPVRMRGLDDR
jgi:hypothetical protein